MQKRGNKALSVVLCALLMLTMAMPALVAAAADAQIVITDEDGAEVTERLEVKDLTLCSVKLYLVVIDHEDKAFWLILSCCKHCLPG